MAITDRMSKGKNCSALEIFNGYNRSSNVEVNCVHVRFSSVSARLLMRLYLTSSSKNSGVHIIYCKLGDK